MRTARVVTILALALAACGTEPGKPPPSAPGGAAPTVTTPAGAAVPAPAPEAWGETVGGLALRLTLDRETYGPGERITATIRARNTGAAPVTLHDFAHDWVFHVRFDSLDGGPAFLGGAGTFIEYDAPEHVTLAPGGEWKRTVGLSEEHRRYLREIVGRKPGDDWDYRPALPAGRWRATISFGHQGADGGFFTGAVRSNAFDVTVRD